VPDSKSWTSRGRAAKHDLFYDHPAVDFFEGALLGNGGLGVVVTTRPDAVILHFGHNNVWDIRMAEPEMGEIGNFHEVFNKVRTIPESLRTLLHDPWYKKYCEKMAEAYAKAYPCPMPCGSIILGFDRRTAELLGHRVQIATGLCEVNFLFKGKPATLQVVVGAEADQVRLRMVNCQEEPQASPFNRIKLLADPVRTVDLPSPEMFSDLSKRSLVYRQRLPAEEIWQKLAESTQDRAFRLELCASVALNQSGQADPYAGINTGSDSDPISVAQCSEFYLDAAIGEHSEFEVSIQFQEGLNHNVSDVYSLGQANLVESFQQVATTTLAHLSQFWERSGVFLEDQELERLWYRNLYYFYCSVRPGVTCPGLWANWSYGKIASVWHGDYHFNYNIQQPFWVAFSSNHVERHLPYVDLIDHVLPVSRKWAQEYYGLAGAAFPHSGYPVDMTVMPYPVPTWGWEICETPWAVQSLWWHYLYTQDEAFLLNRAFEPIREAVTFLAAYMMRPEASGKQFGDDCCHIFPTVSPELYGLVPGLKMNHDCLVDLTLSKFVFNAYLEACRILEIQESEQILIDRVRYILDHFVPYPTAKSEARGEVFVSVPGESPEIVYNTPNSLMSVFPGEEHGLHSDQEDYQRAVNSYLNHRNEGGNDLVFYHLQGARLGILDLEKFKRQVRYCSLPNGTCTDKVMQTGGRYGDTLAFDFMGRMGIFFENFALPVVVNECLLQSYTGILRFFPNWPDNCAAEFRTLRAAGGFLISAAIAGGRVKWIEVRSEKGGDLEFYIPWKSGGLVEIGDRSFSVSGYRVAVPMGEGEQLRVVEASPT